VAAEPAPAIASTKRGWGNGAGKAHANREGKLAILQEMDEHEVRPCRKCGLCESRTQTVFGVGNPDAALMFIGEAPGETEDQRGEPFVGKAGELLNKMIVAMGLTREAVYIANVVKCRPPENRTPTPDETQACWDYLARQIEVIHPRVIVTLGGPATKTLLRTSIGITALRGRWHSYRPQGELADGMLKGRVYPVMPTFHPAYVLRNYNPETRQKVWSDLQQVMTKLAEPE
jgi:DNA polymerase